MDEVMANLTKALDQNVKEILKIKDLNQRKIQADIIKSLCESMGIFFDAMHLMDPCDYEDDMDDMGDPDNGKIPF